MKTYPLNRNDILGRQWNNESAEFLTRHAAKVYSPVDGSILSVLPSNEWWVARERMDPVVSTMIARGFGMVAPKTLIEASQRTITIEAGNLLLSIGPLIGTLVLPGQRVSMGQQLGIMPKAEEEVLLLAAKDVSSNTVLNPLTWLLSIPSALYPEQLPDASAVPPARHRGTPGRPAYTPPRQGQPEPSPEPKKKRGGSVAPKVLGGALLIGIGSLLYLVTNGE